MKAANFKIMLLMILWAVVFYPVYPGLFYSWLETSNLNNSYGIFVPIISAYLIWTTRNKINQAVTANSGKGLFILIISLLIYVVSFAGGIVFLQRMMIVLSLNGLILYIFGKNIYKYLSFPLLFLFFMVPVPDSIVGIISFPLQTYATIISSQIIHGLGIPVYREGHMLYFAHAHLEVAEACSGIRSIMALLMLSVLLMHLSESSRLYKVIIVLSSVAIAFVANIGRVTGTGILAHFFGEKVASGFLHEFSGLAVFALELFVLFAAFKFINRRMVLKRLEANQSSRLTERE